VRLLRVHGRRHRRFPAPLARGASAPRPEVRHRVRRLAVELEERARFDALARRMVGAAVVPAEATATDPDGQDERDGRFGIASWSIAHLASGD